MLTEREMEEINERIQSGKLAMCDQLYMSRLIETIHEQGRDLGKAVHAIQYAMNHMAHLDYVPGSERVLHWSLEDDAVHKLEAAIPDRYS